MTNYKANDIVHVRLDEELVRYLNNGSVAPLHPSDIIAHIPAPEPVVRWVVLYDNNTTGSMYKNRQEADDEKRRFIASPTSILRLEWPDGDMSKPLEQKNVTVEEM